MILGGMSTAIHYFDSNSSGGGLNCCFLKEEQPGNLLQMKNDYAIIPE